MANLAISYARFSSAPQGEGHSLSRQVSDAEAYAASNGLVIDRDLSFRDLGVSAWDKSNINKGALGLFLKAVQAGKVPTGATLIVESFDRLSRATPREAMAIFLQIINAGLDMVTLTEPPKRFSAASVDANMFQLFEALIEMHRSHGESERKSQLLSKSWASRRASAIADRRVMTSKAPSWIKAEGPPRNKTFSVIPERVQVVERVVAMARAGVGNHSIIKTLHAEGVPSWPRSQKEEAKRQEEGKSHSWEPSYIQKMLSHKALYGAVEVKGGEVIEGYYPPVMSYDEFTHLQSIRGTRATRKAANRKGPMVTNLFSGMLKCGYCSSNMIVSGYTSRKTGTQVKYLACHGARTGKTPCRMHGWELDQLEPALLFWLTQVDLSQIVGTKNSGIEDERRALAVIEAKLDKAKQRVEATMDAIADGAKSMVPRLHQYEIEVADLGEGLKGQQRKVAALESQDGGGKSRMKALVLLFKALQKTSDELERRVLREQLSAAVNLVVEKVVMYPMGHTANGTKDARFMDVTFKNGAQRRIEASEC